MPVIRVSEDLFKRLEALAIGFDTPAAVIERLLAKHAEETNATTPNIPSFTSAHQGRPILVFDPPDEDLFKSILIKQRQARVVLHKSDGSSDSLIWNAGRLSENSHLRGNIWSGYLRDWKLKGIVKADFSLEMNDDTS